MPLHDVCVMCVCWIYDYNCQPKAVQLPENTHIIVEAVHKNKQSSSTVIVDYFQVNPVFVFLNAHPHSFFWKSDNNTYATYAFMC